MRERIPIYEPYLRGNERRYVVECLDSTWISSRGQFISRFEEAFSEYTGLRHGISVCNGSVALHLALHCMGIGPGDEVLVPTFTYIASVNAIRMTGATPVFVDSRPADWLLDPADAAARITDRTKAIMPVHLYGFVCDMEAIADLARRHGLKIVEDAAEAVGIFVNGRHVGHLADAAAFSFFGNKTLTCGEGGMVVTNDDALAEDMRIVKNQGMSPHLRYYHDRMGFNYRMTNIQAAIGLAQLEQVDEVIARKREIYQLYREKLADLPLQWQEHQMADVASNYWLVSFLAPSREARDAIMAALESDNIETRPVFICAHQMPHYRHMAAIGDFPVAEDIASRGMSLPSYPGLTEDQIERVCSAVRRGLARGNAAHDG